ncbi:hypothetical protein [Marinirhabdus gelatinilytica]|uniref:YhhN-like protein n=1 Tax=Marinirhabdus gelatinilytica TaxID=1703343 RepID=A0A370QF66_9FLAO|nr:hypothetical protein [Marinirhabdus gelatinilytica]RDK87012.1 hypothetical protein C8D94_102190 [Marinirhabdus gelatinilytica]
MLSFFTNFLILVSVILPILYFIGFSKFGKAYKVFTLYLLFIAIVQGLLFYYATRKIDNLFLFSYYFIGQFLLVSLFYFFLLKKKWIGWLVGAVVVTLIVQYVLSPESYEYYNGLGVSITQTVIVIYALFYYFKSLSGKATFLLVNTGVLLYFLTSLLFFASGNLILSLGLSKEIQLQIGLINEFAYFIFLILIFLEWYRNYRPKKAY